MDTKEFLQEVVPEGNICIAKQAEKGFVQFAFTNHDDAANMAEWLDGKGETVYYALATFKETYNNQFNKLRVRRKRSNIDKLKAIWFDIDFKGSLKSSSEVAKAVYQFCSDADIPAPSILVHSGNGVHVYWTLAESVPYDEWQGLADALKQHAADHGLDADLACTADGARVLRPPGTHNRKDPTTPKPVHVIWSSRVQYDAQELAAALGSPKKKSTSLPTYMRNVKTSAVREFTAGNKTPTSCRPIFTKCAVLKQALITGGENQSEPEWNATLMLLAHVDDGAKLVHAVSKGHPTYDPDETNEKWAQKLEAKDEGSGPTLCGTFEDYHPQTCQSCPYYKSKKVKTPLSLAYTAAEKPNDGGTEKPKSGVPRTASVGAAIGNFPDGFRPVPGNEGVEKKVFDKDAGEWVWDRVLTKTWRVLELRRSVNDNTFVYVIECSNRGSEQVRIEMPGGLVAGTIETWQECALHGVPIPSRERPAWSDLMSTWIDKLRAENLEVDTVDRLGWMESGDHDNPEITGFAAGNNTYYADGDHQTGVSIKKEFEQIGKLYIPTGDLKVWQEAANFVATQSCPAFPAILASAFAAPLIRFTGLPGAVLSLVSTESGVGKTSTLKTAQAVWGSPAKAMNSTHDTHLSITKKIAFLNNLPAYWDELRGQGPLDAFKAVAFDVAQGKEKTRLNSRAQLMQVNEWRTMVIAASNESIFDHMAKAAGSSDASMARTFEIYIDGTEIKADLSAAALFSALDSNYGRAGQIYAEYLAENHKEIAEKVASVTDALSKSLIAQGGERFWVAIIASLLVGAKLAETCELVCLDQKELAKFLISCLRKLRNRASEAKVQTSAREIVIDYIQNHQDQMMTIEKFPAPRERNYTPVVRIRPKTEKLLIARAEGDMYRFRRSDFVTWLARSKEMQLSVIYKEMKSDLHLVELKTDISQGTTLTAGGRSQVFEVNLSTPDDEVEDVMQEIEDAESS